MTTFKNETIWIVGASSGIGRALAEHLSNLGANLILSARRQAELDNLNQDLGGAHKVLPLDVANEEDIHAKFQHIRSNGIEINRAIFLAALYEPQKIADLDIDHCEKMFKVNVLGCFSFTKSMLSLMKEQKQSALKQIALCGSIAAYTGLPNGQPYSASKAAVQNFTESLKAEAPKNIDIKLISPGFIRTRITDKNNFPMPFMQEPEAAAKAIAKGLKSKKFEIHFPKRFTLQVKLLRALPYWLALPLTKNLK
ncbi:MAG: SDR family NAD(P)-dependent oxidoreductase [Rhodomicrobiaceae bacterium]